MEETVLLVDDDENLLRGLARALRQQPYQLLTTRSAEEAIWTLKVRPVDVLVADVRMPGMSGCDLLAWVAERYPEVIGILLTGQATMDTVVRAINEGRVYYFFTKPCDVVQLALTIRKALEHKRLVDEHRRLVQLSDRGHTLPEELLEQLQRLERLVRQDLCQPLERMAATAQGLPLQPAVAAAAEARQTILRLQARCQSPLQVAGAGDRST